MPTFYHQIDPELRVFSVSEDQLQPAFDNAPSIEGSRRKTKSSIPEFDNNVSSSREEELDEIETDNRALQRLRADSLSSTHSPLHPRQCQWPGCNFVTSTADASLIKETLAGHVNISHAWAAQRCDDPNCDSEEVFESASALKKHRTAAHRSKLNEGRYPTRCLHPDCTGEDGTYSSSDTYRYHLVTVHQLDTTDMRKSLLPEIARPTVFVRGQSCPVPHCSTVFNRLACLILHLQSRTHNVDEVSAKALANEKAKYDDTVVVVDRRKDITKQRPKKDLRFVPNQKCVMDGCETTCASEKKMLVHLQSRVHRMTETKALDLIERKAKFQPAQLRRREPSSQFSQPSTPEPNGRFHEHLSTLPELIESG